jgi:hypothetical protein
VDVLCSNVFAFGQKLSFGVITGAAVMDDFRSGSLLRPSTGNILCGAQPCPSQTLTSSDDSRRFIVGLKVELRLAESLSLDVEALHRAVRRKSRVDYSPLLDLGNGMTLASQSFSDTDYTWEFPILARYRAGILARNSFLEGGPSFGPAENNERYGVTVGAGIEILLRGLRFTPRVRYTRWSGKDDGPDPSFRLLRPRSNQVGLLVGIDKPSRSGLAGAFGQDISVGAVAGMGLTDDFLSRVDYLAGIPAQRFFSPIRSPVIGVAVEFQPLKNLFVEVNGLYHPLHAAVENIASLPEYGLQKGTGTRFTVLTWEFPMLAKYKFSIRGTRPFIEAGASLRAKGNLNGTDPSRYGVTGGVGVEKGFGRVKISPAMRYTRWVRDPRPDGGTNPKQVELAVGFWF